MAKAATTNENVSSDAAPAKPAKTGPAKTGGAKSAAGKAGAKGAAGKAAAAKSGSKTKKKVRKNIGNGIVYVQSTFNNTIISVTDLAGNAVAWSSSGARGFKGSRKSTPFAAQLAAEDAARKAMDHGVKSVAIFVSGPGSGRESALRAFQHVGMRVTLIRDITPIPHNGCRPPKRRRV